MIIKWIRIKSWFIEIKRRWKVKKEKKIKVKKERFVDTDRTELTKLGNFGAMMVFIPIFLILEVVD